ncbi:Gelsolin repeat-containing protein [Verticillium alfalfae VaMs.102]|uniref:Gelsolin repeat-containing protein n=1 Tax=Verticillium alfalfae (strain VaMs.102 / ATCC MYA-4576 / FGSC 10136) TaxID=526221 RepID=C9SJS9_VERA1|nr:Gelsolin repeat-containing protein [Verticillium alfalfae VaMs.102]EEY19693.1 Gelsolin repeat-containing protein [Verticillium alfalfae VaMs.102]
MAPNHGLVHPKEYDIKDSNVELIGTDLDHKVKYNSAASEPAWQDGKVGLEPGLLIWRIERFEVATWPKAKYGTFYDGDSFIILHSYQLGDDKDGQPKLGHEIFFWLGAHTTQDEAGTAAYKTVELDEFLHGAATQYRETQGNPSAEFLRLFPRINIRRGGVESGFRHVEKEEPEAILTLLRVFKNPASGSGIVVVEVEPTWRSLDEQTPMEKAKAAQVVHDMKLEKHVDAEVLAQSESRARVVVGLLGGSNDAPVDGFRCPKPLASKSSPREGAAASLPQKLFRLSDASGQLAFDLVKDASIRLSDLDGSDVFLLDDAGKTIWVWEGSRASRQEKSSWLKVAQRYIQHLQATGSEDAYLTPIAKVAQGNESRAFLQAVRV